MQNEWTQRWNERYFIGALFSIDELRSDFPNYDPIELVETEVELDEGAFHKGTGSVIRFVGRKR